MKILFVRHAESRANILHEISNRGLKYPLTPKGRAAAWVLARQLEGRPTVQIYASPVLRALETGMILAHYLNVEYQATDALREYDCGELEGRSDEAAWQAWQEVAEAWLVCGELDHRPAGGESFNDVRARFEPFIENLVECHGAKEGDVVCVSHGGILRLMLPVILNNIDGQVFSRAPLGYLSCVTAELSAGQLTCIDWNGMQVDSV